MKNICLWAAISFFGAALIFDGSVRNDYYTAFSYLFPTNNKFTQDLADTSRLALGLLMSLSVFNIFCGLIFKILALISFVIYSVVTNQQFILEPSLSNRQAICSVVTHIVLIFLCMDSIVNTIIGQQTRVSRQKTHKFIQKTKQQIAHKEDQKKVEETKNKKSKNQNSNKNEGKNKSEVESKNEKKQNKKQEKTKNA